MKTIKELQNHIGHKIICVGYGDFDELADVTIECEDCNEVLYSAETYEINEEMR